MKKITFESDFIIFEHLVDLHENDQELLKIATSQLNNAYAPYSNFHVGACARTIDGNLYTGCNQENASYPLCMCAERVALYHAGTVNPNNPIESLAITVRNPAKKVEGILSPCGACRQVIAEFEHRHMHPIRIILKAEGPEVYVFNSIKTLLPFDFNGTFL